ncbi:ABC transporter C family member 13 isoform X2 [Tripterygium wilfordii]|uniref:ABC transporter C family member 13 isoform X2 n=1 Tax=Tripterygium wilfordii TaxID=458696 RepID=UPI0018F8419C|nr:ABC transporter C family member 13 isoform X2 [Tripterygium wilfordii]
MTFKSFVCPNSPLVWDGGRFSKCFNNLFLGFGVNLVSIVIISLLAIAKRNARKNLRVNLAEKVLLHLLPVLGACLSIVDLVLLLKTERNGSVVVYDYDQGLFNCSQLIVWISIMLSSKCACSYYIFCNWILSLWWIIKLLLGSVRLLATFSSLEVLNLLKEISIVLLDVVFGIYINVIRVKYASPLSSSLEDSLLVEKDIEEGCFRNSGNSHSYWDLLTFQYVTPVMNRGAVKQLDLEDLLLVPADMDVCSGPDKLLRSWQTQASSNFHNPSLFRAICHAYGWAYFRIGLLKVLNDCIGFMGPLILNRLIKYLQQGSRRWDGYLLAISLGLVSVLKSFLDTQYSYHLSKLKLKLRSSIMTATYRKCLFVSLAERSKFSDGEIQTFMSVDADRIVNLCNSLHDSWSLPLQIGVALYLLYTQVKFAFISGLAITIILIPVNKWISELIANATEKMMKQKDERIRRAGELLTHIRTLKMYGWEHLFSSWLLKTRSSEVKHLATRKYLDAWCVFFWATTPTLFSLSTFGLYTLMGHELDAATVFTCLALFNNLISPLNSFPWVINGLIDAFISTRRLSRFLCCREYNPQPERATDQPDFIPEDMAVLLNDACSTWSSYDEECWNLVLNHVTLNLPKGSLVAVVGEVGSGKSSLLNSILGEMRLIRGTIHCRESIAYVPQVPWILSGTIRENILLGKNYESQRYSDTLKACALDADILQMVGGDMAYIGEKGANLSGGQRARLALARALYHGSDIYVLDDVLSAVDAQVARWILQNAIMGPLMGHKTRILCTHNIQAISKSDMIVVMDKGHVKWVGNSAESADSLYSAYSPLNDFNAASDVRDQECGTDAYTVSRQSILPENDSVHALEEAQEIVEVETRKEGKVELTVYKSYAIFSGWLVTLTICLSAILMQASRNGNDLWLSYWVDTTGSIQAKYSTSFYLVILCIFCIINSFLTLVRAFSFAYGGLQAAVQVHNILLSKLINAPVYFFDQTPRGRILNRLSSDLYTIDDSLPFILNILLANFVGLLGIAIVLSYVQVFFLLLLLPFWFIYNKLQFFYRSTSRELRRLDSVSRSPIYAIFMETLDGSSTLRAFKSEGLFLSSFTEHVALYQQTSFSELTASLWLSLRLQLLAAFIVSFVGMSAVFGSFGYLPISIGTPGLVGLALSYAAPVVSLLGSFLTSYSETEKEMVSVERVLHYMDIPQENLRGCQSLEAEWPFQGMIEFQNVTMRYMPSLPPALRDITFTIAGGTQVGIVGRTGAGKSSVLNALFRLTEISDGRILVDGIKISDVPVTDLRAHFAIVPQSPFLFEGSLRDNLDPLQMNDDLRIWNALEKCHIKEEVEAVGGLEIHVKESGTSFSVGQRQLLCLARALLKSSKVLCLDECTANVDTQTALIIQNAISSECRGMTVITIAHRISTVLSKDNILILDKGKLVEQGNPQALLLDKLSIFSSFAKASAM